jgi:hypothetical protein
VITVAAHRFKLAIAVALNRLKFMFTVAMDKGP